LSAFQAARQYSRPREGHNDYQFAPIAEVEPESISQDYARKAVLDLLRSNLKELEDCRAPGSANTPKDVSRYQTHFISLMAIRASYGFELHASLR
jgi:hypothetical protein